MSDESELARLRADLKAMGRVEGLVYFGEDFKVRFYEKLKAIRDKIAKLEAAADPWRDARGWISSWRGQNDYPVVVAFFDHLTAENARLTARVWELEAEIKAEDDADVADAGDVLSKEDIAAMEAFDIEEMIDEHVFPCPLDPARVLATARHILKDSDDSMHGSIAYLMWCHVKESQDAKPYPLKKGGE